MVGLLAAASWNIFRLIKGDGGVSDNKFIHIVVIVYQFILAGVMLLSMRGNEKVLFYFGFLRGKLSKILFLLFCAAIVFPIDVPDSSDAWLLDVGGGILAVVAIL